MRPVILGIFVLCLILQPLSVLAAEPIARPTQSGSQVLQPAGTAEVCLDMEAGDEIRYAFESDIPLDFNIHFHEAQSVRYPVTMGPASAVSNTFHATEAQAYCLMWTNPGEAPASLNYRISLP